MSAASCGDLEVERAQRRCSRSGDVPVERGGAETRGCGGIDPLETERH